MADVRTIRAGASKPHPFTIVIVANPALESPRGSGAFVADPILAQPAAFAAAVTYIDDSLFGALPGQAELLLGDPTIAPQVRVLSIFDPTAAPTAANSLVAADAISNLLVPRRTAFAPFAAARGVGEIDIGFAVSASESHRRASAFFTTDDDARGGVPFTLDGAPYSHRFFNRIPGTAAIHSNETALTAVHEFEHAISSYSNGAVVDLYVDPAKPPAGSNPFVNCRWGRPIPAHFASYNGVAHASDPTRDSLGYAPGWNSYHCELNAAAHPAAMDNYWLGSGGPLACENDTITRQFVFDRVRAKLIR